MKLTYFPLLYVILFVQCINCELAPEDQPLWDSIAQIGKRSDIFSKVQNSWPTKNNQQQRKQSSSGNYADVVCDGCLVGTSFRKV